MTGEIEWAHWLARGDAKQTAYLPEREARFEADLRRETWGEHIGAAPVDAVLRTTARHWLPAENPITLYQKLGIFIRPGGLFLNGDHLRFRPHLPTFRQVSEAVTQKRSAAYLARPGAEGWQQWWDALAAEPALTVLPAERERRRGNRQRGPTEPIFDLHQATLRDASFREVGVIGQTMRNRILLPARGPRVSGGLARYRRYDYDIVDPRSSAWSRLNSVQGGNWMVWLH